MKIKIPKNIKKKATRIIGKTTLQLRKHLPDILIAVGITAGGGAVVAASVETNKLEPVLDRARNRIDDIHAELQFVQGNQPSEKELKIATTANQKELAKAYMATAMDFVKLYLPAIALETVSVVCILSGHKIMHKRNVELAAAYSAVYNAFQAYRNRVVDRYGKDVDYDLYHNTTTKTVIDSETGEETKIREMNGEPDDYILVFDSSNPNYDINPKYSRLTLTNAQQYANDLLYNRGYVFLNEICEDLNMPVTTRGQVVGWCMDDTDESSDKYVDLRIQEVTKKRADGLTETIFTMDPNVDGTIVYKLGKVAR